MTTLVFSTASYFTIINNQEWCWGDKLAIRRTTHILEIISMVEYSIIALLMIIAFISL